MTNFHKDEGDAILIAFAEAGPAADLTEWMRRYPECAGDLARFARSRWMGETAAEDAAATARIAAIGQSVLKAMREAQPAPITSLRSAAQARGLDADSLAERLRLPVAYFWKLHRRLFAPDSVPRALVAALAESLDRTAEDVSAYLRRPPVLAAGASYRADDAPRVGAQEDFSEVLRTDPEVTAEQRARYLPEDAA